MLEKEFLVQGTRDEEEEAEETLSLCDLPLYSDRSSEWEDECSSSVECPEEDDYFEFSSQELARPCVKSNSVPENIIFCGKLIPYKQPDKVMESKELGVESKKKKSMFSWNFSLKRSSKVHVSNSMSSTKSKRDDQRKMSALTPSLSGKAAWYLCMFGVASFSQEAALRDRKNRQKLRKQPLSPMFGFPTTGEDNCGSRGGNKGAWGLMRALSCGANHPTATNVAASITYY